MSIVSTYPIMTKQQFVYRKVMSEIINLNDKEFHLLNQK